ncbi:MAG: hypothetical protein NVS1B6_20060 [Steroidobacteraceae bacterium]
MLSGPGCPATLQDGFSVTQCHGINSSMRFWDQPFTKPPAERDHVAPRPELRHNIANSRAGFVAFGNDP